MLITSFFTDEDNLPVTGLTPVVDIYNLQTKSTAIVDGVMTEVDAVDVPGLYEYEFVGYNPEHIYFVYSDGGDTLTNYDRFQDKLINAADPLNPVVDFGS